MGFFDRLRAELIDIVEFLDDSNDTLVYRFERYGNEIKNGAQLIVREGQQAIFVDQGQLADIFTPGIYTLETSNLPLLSTLRGWKYGFESPFKAEVYFVSTRQFTDLKWGTKNPIMVRDPEFGPIRLRAFGTYSIRAKDPAALLREIVGTDGHFTTGEITDQLRSLVVARFADTIAQEQTAALDMAANYDEFGELIRSKIAGEFEAYGIELTKFLVENISLPPEVEQALDKRTSMGIIGNLNAYSQFQAANAMEKAAQNPGGAGAGFGMGMGMMMGQGAGQTAYQQPQQQAPQAPPPLPSVAIYVAKDGQQTGPFDMAQLANMVQAGQFGRDSLVWKAGMTNWQKASDTPDVAPLFNQAPPPLPGA